MGLVRGSGADELPTINLPFIGDPHERIRLSQVPAKPIGRILSVQPPKPTEPVKPIVVKASKPTKVKEPPKQPVAIKKKPKGFYATGRKKEGLAFDPKKDQDLIEEFLRNREVTRGKTVYSAPTQVFLTDEEEKEKIAKVAGPVKRTAREVMEERRRISTELRRARIAKRRAQGLSVEGF